MKIYLDSSALVKLVQVEDESTALRRYLRRHRDDLRVSSALALVEVVRAVGGGGADARAHARRLIARLHLVSVTDRLLDRAADLAPSLPLRSLDAIHVASARELGPDLRGVVTYDRRMSEAAETAGLVVVAPR
jgi:predicted nucleic acid-binding protein